MQNPALSPRLRGINHSPRVERRRSSLLRAWGLNDGSPGSPGTADPQRQRAPSLGELHQELENEQEAQVNRLLSMIRQQQAQLLAMQSNQVPATPSTTTTTTEDQAIHTPTSERSLTTTPAPGAPTISTQQPPHTYHSYPPHPRSYSPIPRTSTSSMSRQSSERRASSRNTSPMLYPMQTSTSSHGAEGQDWVLGTPASGHARDEVAFYQAETQNVLRENAMLKNRIRELERQLEDASTGAGE